jgi:hypothetical protein
MNTPNLTSVHAVFSQFSVLVPSRVLQTDLSQEDIISVRPTPESRKLWKGQSFEASDLIKGFGKDAVYFYGCYGGTAQLLHNSERISFRKDPDTIGNPSKCKRHFLEISLGEGLVEDKTFPPRMGDLLMGVPEPGTDNQYAWWGKASREFCQMVLAIIRLNADCTRDNFEVQEKSLGFLYGGPPSCYTAFWTMVFYGNLTEMYRVMQRQHHKDNHPADKMVSLWSQLLKTPDLEAQWWNIRGSTQVR